MQAEMISINAGTTVARKAPPNKRGKSAPLAPNPGCPLLFEVAGSRTDLEYPEAEFSMYKYVAAETVAIEAFYRDATSERPQEGVVGELLFAHDSAKEAAIKALQGNVLRPLGYRMFI